VTAPCESGCVAPDAVERYGGRSGNRLPDLVIAISELLHSAMLRATSAGNAAKSVTHAELNRKEVLCFSPYLYRARNLVERFFNKIKQCRRVATRYDKLAANFLAFIQLASIRLWLRANESTPLNENSWQLGNSVAFALSALRLAPPNTQHFRHPHQVGE
jgi:hypothetical protein